MSKNLIYLFIVLNTCSHTEDTDNINLPFSPSNGFIGRAVIR